MILYPEKFELLRGRVVVLETWPRTGATTAVAKFKNNPNVDVYEIEPSIIDDVNVLEIVARDKLDEIKQSVTPNSVPKVLIISNMFDIGPTLNKLGHSVIQLVPTPERVDGIIWSLREAGDTSSRADLMVKEGHDIATATLEIASAVKSTMTAMSLGTNFPVETFKSDFERLDYVSDIIMLGLRNAAITGAITEVVKDCIRNPSGNLNVTVDSFGRPRLTLNSPLTATEIDRILDAADAKVKLNRPHDEYRICNRGSDNITLSYSHAMALCQYITEQIGDGDEIEVIGEQASLAYECLVDELAGVCYPAVKENIHDTHCCIEQ